MVEKRNRVLMAAGITLVGVVVALWLLRSDVPVPGEAAARRPDAPAPVEPATAEVTRLEPADRIRAPTPAPLPPAVDQKLAHVRGRCVDETGRALPGCT